MTPEGRYQIQYDEAAKNVARQLNRFPDPLRTHHVASLFNVDISTVQSWRRKYRQTGKLIGPQWDEITKQTLVYPKWRVERYLVEKLIGPPPEPSRFAKQVG